VARFTRLPSPGKTPTTLVRLGPPPQTNRPPLGQGKRPGALRGKEEARMAPPPRPPDPLFPPPPPPRDLPGRFPRQARPNASYPCLPSSSSANRGKTPGRQTGPPPKPPPEARQDEPPWPSPPAPPGWPEAAWRGRAGRWGRLAVDTCRSTNPVSRGSGKGWGRGRCRAYGWALSRGGAPGWSPWHPLFSHTPGIGVE
jgi:hypothetical protein